MKTKTIRVFNETGHWYGDGFYERHNAKGVTYHVDKFDAFEIDVNANWIIEMIRWCRYYKTQNGRKAPILTKVVLYEYRPRVIEIPHFWGKIMCFTINALPKTIQRKKKLWFGL